MWLVLTITRLLIGEPQSCLHLVVGGLCLAACGWLVGSGTGSEWALWGSRAAGFRLWLPAWCRSVDGGSMDPMVTRQSGFPVPQLCVAVSSASCTPAAALEKDNKTGASPCSDATFLDILFSREMQVFFN